MTHRLTVRAFPDGEVWFFEKENRDKYEQAKKHQADSKGNRGHPEVPEKWRKQLVACNSQS